MKDSKKMLGLSLVGALVGYAISKYKKKKDSTRGVITGAIAGGIAGIALTQFTKKDTEEIKLSIPTPISIERS